MPKLLRNFIFGGIVLLTTYLIYVYPVYLIAHLLFGTAIAQTSSIVLTALIFLLVFTYLRTHLSSPLLSGFIYYGMGVGFIGFSIFNFGYLAALIMPSLTTKIAYIALILFMIITGISLHKGRAIKLKTLSIESPKLSQSKTIIFISDIHLGSNPKRHAQNIVDMINALSFDILLIGGDLYDASSFNPEDLSPFKAINSPIYFVTGNHEYYVKDHAGKLEALSQYGISTLDNEHIMLDEINLIGVSDNQHPSKQYSHAASLVQEGRFNLLMVHQPSIWSKVSDQVDLMLSGHTHNGQIFPFNLLVRMQFKNVYGLYRDRDASLYVSSGSGTWGPRMRLGTQNEVVQIKLQAS